MRICRAIVLRSVFFSFAVACFGLMAWAGEAPLYVKADTWPGTVAALRRAISEAPAKPESGQIRGAWLSLAKDFPVQADWLLQDAGGEDALYEWLGGAESAELGPRLVHAALKEAGSGHEGIEDSLKGGGDLPNAADAEWLSLYERACEARRRVRLAALVAKWPRLVFTKHYDLGGSHYAYTEGLSDAQNERTFKPGSSLCVVDLDGGHGEVHTLIDDPDGVIRDPDVSYDGQRILFAWKKSDRQDDYHLYEYSLAAETVRQLTFGLGFADYEGVYLPNGDIVFNSTRCVQIVDCWWTEVSNLYACDGDGNYLRRLTFDQVHTNYPTVTHDGRILYTRWDYNDRGQIYPQPLFQMRLDGTGQTECYGNNAWFPTTILHARAIPGTQKLVAVLSGHHCHQRGKLALIDTRAGRQEADGVQLIAPVRPTEAVRVDAYGQDGDQFQYPYPFDERNYLVTYGPYHGGNREYPHPYGIYLMDIHGRRELLASDPGISCNQSIPLAARPMPHDMPSMADYTTDTASYYLQDIYAGPGLEGVPRGSIKRLRVVALGFRAAGIGSNRCYGPAGGALASTPVAAGGGAWDVKIVLGEAEVYEDGSAFFTVPARTPVYFQALDGKGHAVQTMRTWSTLQPGERFSCAGCHEHKSEAPQAGAELSMAMHRGPKPLSPFYGSPQGFSFPRIIQPILDQHCIRCHNDRAKSPGYALAENPDDTGMTGAQADEAAKSGKRAFSLLDARVADPFAKRKWSDAYLSLLDASQGELDGKPGDFRAESTERISWAGAQSVPTLLPPYTAGAAKSGLITMLEEGHNGVHLSKEEMDKLACWIDLYVPFCGDYLEANAWTEEERSLYKRFEDKRRSMEDLERRNIAAFLARERD